MRPSATDRSRVRTIGPGHGAWFQGGKECAGRNRTGSMNKRRRIGTWMSRVERARARAQRVWCARNAIAQRRLRPRLWQLEGGGAPPLERFVSPAQHASWTAATLYAEMTPEKASSSPTLSPHPHFTAPLFALSPPTQVLSPTPTSSASSTSSTAMT